MLRQKGADVWKPVGIRNASSVSDVFPVVMGTDRHGHWLTCFPCASSEG